jgi:hypothetical protein
MTCTRLHLHTMSSNRSNHPATRRNALGARARLSLLILIGLVVIMAVAFLVSRGYDYPAKRTDWRKQELVEKTN